MDKILLLTCIVNHMMILQESHWFVVPRDEGVLDILGYDVKRLECL